MSMTETTDKANEGGMDDRSTPAPELTAAASTGGHLSFAHRVRHVRRAHRLTLTPFARMVGCEIQLHAGELLLPEIAASVVMIALFVAAAVWIATWWATALLFVALVLEIVVVVATVLDILGDNGDSGDAADPQT